MANFKELMVSVLLIGLFIVAMTNGALYLTNDNNSTNALSNNTAYADLSSEVQTDLESAEGVANDFKDGFSQEDTSILTQSIVFLGSIYKGIKTTMSLFISILTAPLTLFGDTALDVSPLVLTIFTAMIILILVLMGWKLIKTGA